MTGQGFPPVDFIGANASMDADAASTPTIVDQMRHDIETLELEQGEIMHACMALLAAGDTVAGRDVPPANYHFHAQNLRAILARYREATSVIAKYQEAHP